MESNMELIKTFLIFAISGYKVCLWVLIISSWFPKLKNNILISKINEIAEISCTPIRKILKFKTIDLSPLLVYLILNFIQLKLMTLSFTGV